MATYERHGERGKDRERLERIRFGTAAAAIMNTGFATKKDKTVWMPWDVFSELQPLDEEIDEASNADGILTLFTMMAAGQQAREDSN